VLSIFMNTLFVLSSFLGASSAISSIFVSSGDVLSFFFGYLSKCPCMVAFRARICDLRMFIIRCGHIIKNSFSSSLSSVNLTGKKNALCRNIVKII